MTEAEQEEMLALEISEHQRPRDPVEHIGRGRSAAPLFKPSVPGRTDIGALRHFFTAKPRGAAALRRKAEGLGIELGPAFPEVSPEQVLVGGGFAHPVSYYTTIISLLY
jgi:hypothetical protein